jgi:DNA replication licensing factor MCM4
MNAALFRCCNCQAEVYLQLESSRVSEPKICNHCKLKDTLEIIHNACNFTDKQFIKFQELPELVPEGETPTSIIVLAYGVNVDGLRPGDRVDVVGIYRVNPTKIQRNQSSVFSLYSTYIDMISFNRVEETTLKIVNDIDSMVFYSDEDKDLFHKMSDSPTIIHDLVKSFVPSIYGHD